jgi:excisionase family DNA binding protein
MSKTTDREPREGFWTVAEIAEDVKVVPRTVRRWIDSGELVAHRLGRSVRVSGRDYRAFLACRRGL